MRISAVITFSDGNGRMGRLWQSLLLRRRNSLFEWLPVETMVAEHQLEYYDVLTVSQRDADCTQFVEFMLRIILQIIEKVHVEQISEQINNQIADRQMAIASYLKGWPRATMEEIAAASGISEATARRELSRLRALGFVSREGSRKAGCWKVKE